MTKGFFSGNHKICARHGSHSGVDFYSGGYDTLPERVVLYGHLFIPMFFAGQDDIDSYSNLIHNVLYFESWE